MPGIRTYESFSGFIASEPNTEPTRKGKPRFFAYAGQNQFDKEPDGTYTKTGTEHRPLVAFDKVAEEMAKRFARGDNFVAEGYSRSFSYEKDGRMIEGEEFVVWKIGHDIARTRYDVDRAPRAGQSIESENVTRSRPRREPAGTSATSRASREPSSVMGM